MPSQALASFTTRVQKKEKKVIRRLAGEINSVQKVLEKSSSLTRGACTAILKERLKLRVFQADTGLGKQRLYRLIQTVS